jgi:hypothetical protein
MRRIFPANGVTIGNTLWQAQEMGQRRLSQWDWIY